MLALNLRTDVLGLTDPTKQFGDGRIERLGKCVESRDRQILLAPFDCSDIRAVESTHGGEFFL
jgi:hypothetical protein